MGQFKNTNAVRVVSEESKHFNKLGVITDNFSLKGMGPNLGRQNTKYIILFSDGTTGTVDEEHLEKFKIPDGPLIPMPARPKNEGNVWVMEKEGKVVVYTLGNIIYGEPPENAKEVASAVFLPQATTK